MYEQYAIGFHKICSGIVKMLHHIIFRIVKREEPHANDSEINNVNDILDGSSCFCFGTANLITYIKNMHLYKFYCCYMH